MAIELVKAYKNNKIAGPEDVTHLMPKLLNLTPNKEEEEKRFGKHYHFAYPSLMKMLHMRVLHTC